MQGSYSLVRNKPVASFYYKGSHGRPVRRTVLVTEQTPEVLRGYEIRCGNTTVSREAAPVKSYSVDKICHWGDYANIRGKGEAGKTTLVRYSMKELDAASK